MGAAIGLVLVIVSLLLGLREQSLYTTQRDGLWKDGTDLFLYTKGRFRVRLFGLGTASVLGIALFAWDLWPPVEPSGLMAYVIVFSVSSLALIITVVADLVITARTARPDELMRQGDPARRTRTQPRPPQ